MNGAIRVGETLESGTLFQNNISSGMLNNDVMGSHAQYSSTKHTAAKIQQQQQAAIIKKQKQQQQQKKETTSIVKNNRLFYG